MKQPDILINQEMTASLKGKSFVAAASTLKGRTAITMSRGQWDPFLQVTYDANILLLELDDHERVTRVFEKESTAETVGVTSK